LQVGGIRVVWKYFKLGSRKVKHIHRLSGAEAPNVIINAKGNSNTLETAILNLVERGNGNLRTMESGANE